MIGRLMLLTYRTIWACYDIFNSPKCDIIISVLQSANKQIKKGTAAWFPYA